MRRSIAFAIALSAGAAAVAGGPLGMAAMAPQKVVQAATGQRVVTLNVSNVSCVTCGPIVTRALRALPGVALVSVNEGGATARVRVVYDPRKVTPAALAKATTDAGFPAKVVNKIN